MDRNEDKDIKDAKQALRLSVLEKPTKVVPIKLQSSLHSFIKHRGPVSTWIRNLVLRELKRMVNGE